LQHDGHKRGVEEVLRVAVDQDGDVGQLGNPKPGLREGEDVAKNLGDPPSGPKLGDEMSLVRLRP
jgi:hypothetical protein